MANSEWMAPLCAPPQTWQDGNIASIPGHSTPVDTSEGTMSVVHVFLPKTHGHTESHRALELGSEPYCPS